MRFSIARVREHCRRRGESLSEMLRRAGVSRNAFYSLARRGSLLPGSLLRVGEALETQPENLVEAEDSKVDSMRRLLAKAEAIAKQNPGADFDTIRHVLLLLRKDPLERLRRALVRAR